MKELASIDQAVGTEGAKVSGKLGVEADQLKLEVGLTYPISKVIDPVMNVFDKLIDNIEQFIPGDQKAMAVTAKTEARAALVKALSEQSV